MCSMPYITSHVWTTVLCQLVVLSWVSVLCSRWVFWHFSRTYCLHLLGDQFWFTWMLQQLGRMFQLHGKATGNTANQSCEKCSVLLALSFPHSYNFPVSPPLQCLLKMAALHSSRTLEHSSTTQCRNPKEDHQLTFLNIIIIMLFLLLSLSFWEDVCSRSIYSLVCLLMTCKYPNQLTLALSITV
jgi:hypothetical protein